MIGSTISATMPREQTRFAAMPLRAFQAWFSHNAMLMLFKVPDRFFEVPHRFEIPTAKVL